MINRTTSLNKSQNWQETRANKQNRTVTFLEFSDEQETETMEQQSWQQLRAKSQNQTATLLDMDDDSEDELVISSQQESWQKLRAKAQNQVATLLDIDDDDEDELVISSQQQLEVKKTNFALKPLPMINHQQNWQQIKEKAQRKATIFPVVRKKANLVTDYKYKLIAISKIEQLKPLQHLIPLEVRKQLQKHSDFLKLRGIVAKDSQKNVALILVDVSDNSRVAKTIHLAILPDYFDRKIGRRLVQCLTKSLPKINCDRLRLNNQARLFI